MQDRPPGDPLPDRYSRQAIFPPLGREGQERLRASRVLIVGCGALGSRSAEHLARSGVGFLRLIDRDVVDSTNLHRSAYTEADAREGIPKALALAAHLNAANSEVRLDPRSSEFNHLTALDLAEGIDLILDGTDNAPARFLLNDVSLSRKIPWIYCGVVGETGCAQLFLPGGGPCLRCAFPDLPPAGEIETCDVAGVLGPAAGAIASFQAGMAIRCLAGGRPAALGLAGKQVRLRIWSLEAAVSTSLRDPDCPACGAGKLEFLSGKGAEETTVLCGRSTIHVRPPRSPEALDLAALAAKLGPLGKVEARRHFLRFETEGFSMTVFPDGRAVIDGVSDPARARAIHARYVGL